MKEVQQVFNIQEKREKASIYCTRPQGFVVVAGSATYCAILEIQRHATITQQFYK